MRQRIRRILIVYLLALTIAAAYGCAAPAEEAPAEEVPAEEVVVVEEVVEEEPVEEVVEVEVEEVMEEVSSVLLLGWSSGATVDDLQRELLEECRVAYQLEASYTDYWDVLSTRLAAGEAPDIIYVATTNLPFAVEQGFLYPLDEIYEIDWDSFLEPTVEAFSYQGDRFAVPREFSTLALYYNRPILEELGLEEPRTWDELWDVSSIILEVTGRPGFAVTTWPSRFAPFVFQSGGQLMSDDYRETGINSAEAIEAGEFYQAAYSEGWAALPEEIGAGWPGEAFGREEVAMALEGYWLGSYLRDEYPGLEYGVSQPPAGHYGEGNILFGTGYAVSAGSSDPVAALEAIECLTGEEAQAKMLDSGLLLPPGRMFQEDVADPAAQAIYEGARFSTPYSWGPRHDEIDYALSSALERLLSGADVYESFDEAAEEIYASIEYE